MSARAMLVAGAALAALGVALGAFGAHGLEERLREADQLESWRTAVRYQMWHALALVLVSLLRERRPVHPFVPWAFLVGVLLFSGSIYCLALGVLRPVLGPVTPLGGSLLIGAWIALGAGSLRRADEPRS